MRSVIECLREYILQFPLLKDGALNVDHLGDQAIEYTVDAVPCSPVYRQYTDGSCMKQFLFLFASREYYSADVNQCIENLAFYEEFSKWIEKQNKDGSLPDLDGREAISVEVLTAGYAFDCDAETARYQIQMRLLYEEE